MTTRRNFIRQTIAATGLLGVSTPQLLGAIPPYFPAPIPKAVCSSVFDLFNVELSDTNIIEHNGSKIYVPYSEITQTVDWKKKYDDTEVSCRGIEILNRNMDRAIENELYHTLMTCAADHYVYSKISRISNDRIVFCSPEFLDENHNKKEGYKEFPVLKNKDGEKLQTVVCYGLGEGQIYQEYWNKYFGDEKEIALAIKPDPSIFRFLQLRHGMRTVSFNCHLHYNFEKDKIVETPRIFENRTLVAGIQVYGAAVLNSRNVELIRC